MWKPLLSKYLHGFFFFFFARMLRGRICSLRSAWCQYNHSLQEKGDRSDCKKDWYLDSYQCWKNTCCIGLNVRQVLAGRVYPESQRSFRLGRSTTDIIFSMREIQGKFWEQQSTETTWHCLYRFLIPRLLSFDLVSREGLFDPSSPDWLSSKAFKHHHYLFS